MFYKILFLFVIFGSFTQVHAFYCENKETGAWGGGRIDVPLDSDLISGTSGTVNEFADINSFYICANEAPNQYTDWLFMQSFSTPLRPAIAFGVQINGVNYFEELPGDTLVLEFPIKNEASFPLPLKLIMRVGDRPSDGVFIKKGDLLMTTNMMKYAYLGEGSTTPIDYQYFTWSFYADNDVILPAGTCDINDGQLILVNLGTVHRSRISSPGGGATSDGATDVEITYQCKNNDGTIDTSYNEDIRLYLSAIPSSFSSGAVQVKSGWAPGTGNVIPYLGMEFYHKNSNQLLTPNDQAMGYFKTRIENGRGGPDIIRVGPVKDTTILSQNIAEGEFNSVATLIMTLD